jgi:hypothetical protein
MATKTKSYGAKLSYVSSGTSYTDLTDIISITLPNLERADVDLTHLESGNNYREYGGGWIEPGTIEFEGYFTKTQFSTLKATLLDGGSDGYSWKVTFPLISGESTASTLVATGYLKSIGSNAIDSSPDGRITCPFAVKVTGKPTFTAGS